MHNVSPVYLAWSNLRQMGTGLLGPLQVLLVCLLLLFTLVGLYSLPQDGLASLPMVQAGRDSSLSSEDDIERGGARHTSNRMPGAVAVCLVVVLLFRSVFAAAMSGHVNELIILHTLGYSPLYLRSVFFAESLFLILLALVPAALLAPGVDAVIRDWTGWPLSLTPMRFGTTLFLAIMLGAFAAWLAIPRKMLANSGH